jgi:hypothetical protein
VLTPAFGRSAGSSASEGFEPLDKMAGVRGEPDSTDALCSPPEADPISAAGWGSVVVVTSLTDISSRVTGIYRPVPPCPSRSTPTDVRRATSQPHRYPVIAARPLRKGKG